MRTPVGHFTSSAGRIRFRAAYAHAMSRLPSADAVLDLPTTFGVVRCYRFDGPHQDRKPLVLLPGRSSASPVWAANLPSLVQVAPVYTVDLLGEPGLSVQTRPIRNAADQAAWMHEVLLQLPEPLVHLLGVSIGGWTAANLAVREPAKVASLTLLDPVFVFAGMSTQAIIRSIPASVWWLPRVCRDAFTSWTANGAPVEHDPVANMIATGMQTYALRLPAPNRLSPNQLRALKMPVLVIVAGRSPMHNAAAVADGARAALRNGQVEVYAGASHAINGEYPEQIAADVAAFLPG